ncbi:MAG: hypothetical protein JWR18_4082, partial [Segetibacter sp.]|nr:hypothetical protein [Segetibacter sp.]
KIDGTCKNNKHIVPAVKESNFLKLQAKLAARG